MFELTKKEYVIAAFAASLVTAGIAIGGPTPFKICKDIDNDFCGDGVPCVSTGQDCDYCTDSTSLNQECIPGAKACDDLGWLLTCGFEIDAVCVPVAPEVWDCVSGLTREVRCRRKECKTVEIQ